MKKIIFVITKSNWGGAQRYVFDLATSISGQFDVAVATGGTGMKGAPAGALVERLRERGVRTLFLPSFARDIFIGRDLRAFFELVRLFRRERPDIIHLNSSKAGGLGALAGRVCGVPKIIFTSHGWPFMEDRPILWRAFAYAGSWITALLAHRVIVITKSELERGRRLPFCAAKMRLIYNGIAPMQFGSGEIIRRAFPAGAKITGTIGELTHNKNQIALIEQARRDREMYVAIVGEGEDRARLESKIRKYGLQDRVKLFGFIPAREALQGFDVFSLPSLKEGLPYVLLEARAAGLYVAASRTGGTPDILDAEDLSEFSLDRMLEKTIALYRS